MKNIGFGKRLLAMLLTVAVLLSAVPQVWAARGDISDGETGLKSGTDIDTSKSISWPIKIYDYLNDGMLFEYASAQDFKLADSDGDSYGGGKPPVMLYNSSYPKENIPGVNYTIADTYSSYAYSHFDTTASGGNYTNAMDTTGMEAVPSAVTAVNYKSPLYMHLEVPTTETSGYRTYTWAANFANDHDRYYTKDQVRYAVMVYRTDTLSYEAAGTKFYWAVSNDSYDTDYSHHTSTGRDGIDISDLGTVGTATNGNMDTRYELATPKSAEWTYVCVDMKRGDVATNWDVITGAKVAGIGLCYPVNNPGEWIDISHMAFFATEEEAKRFGEDAVAFNNDPGEYLPSHTEYTDGQEVAVSKPSTGYNGMDFSVSSGGGYDVDTYQDWTTAVSGRSYINGISVTKVSEGERSYVRLSNKKNSSNKGIRLWHYDESGLKSNLRYVTVVYRTKNFTANNSISCFVEYTLGDGANLYQSGISGTSTNTRQTLTRSESEWTYFTYDLNKIANGDSDYNSLTYVTGVGLYLPACMTGTNQILEVAFVNCQSTSALAESYGKQAAAYMNGETEIVSGSYTTQGYQWNMGSNTAFTMLYASQGGGWLDKNDDSVMDSDASDGGNNPWTNGYYTYQIGYNTMEPTSYSAPYQEALKPGGAYDHLDYVVSDDIFLLNLYGNYASSLVGADATFDSSTGKAITKSYRMSQLDFGYTLYNTLTKGVMTAGLLNPKQIEVVDQQGDHYKIPEYKNDTIDYIAQLLEATLVIPEKDRWGYNYNHVMGTASSQFAYTYDATTKTVSAGVDGETEVDLATALRKRLGISFATLVNNKGTTSTARGKAASLTAAQRAKLIGSFEDCVANIDSFTAAAYYLLHNLFIDDSYNQRQYNYNYLVLSQAELSDGTTAFVFDAGFSDADGTSAIEYDPIRTVTNADGTSTVVGKGTIGLSSAYGKDQIEYQDGSYTTLFPFLPIYDADDAADDEYKANRTPYFQEDGAIGVSDVGATYYGRNYNYVMQANGEFVYHYEDGLFFEFEGDDDVYLFINGQLVLDIGAAHSITTVDFNMNDYVDWALAVQKGTMAYDAAQGGSTMYKDLTAEQKARVDALALKDGESYSIDFYYMERHGWGANMRIATNIVMTDPALQTQKTAYQDGIEVPYGSVVDAGTLVEYSFAMTNGGNNKLYRLAFQDASIGVSLDCTNGLVVTGDNVTDATGGKLEPEDLVFTIDGYYDEAKTQPTGTIPVTFADRTVTAEDGTTSVYTAEQQLKDFLYDLTSLGTQSGEETSSLFAGSGLWRHGTVTVRGIWYTLPDGVELFDNTVHTSAHPSVTSDTIVKGEDTHRIRAVSDPIYFYQWAGHPLGIHRQYFYDQLNSEFKADITQFWNFLMYPCLADGTECTWPSVTNSSGTLLTVNYPDPGRYLIYVKLFKNTVSNSSNIPDVREDSDTTNDDEYLSIVPVVFYVTDVADSTIVLDYGLKAELTAEGGIYANDSLQPHADARQQIMGITTTAPAYMEFSYSEGYLKANDCRINFTPAIGPVSSSNLAAVDGSLPSSETFDGQYSVEDGKLFFTPTAFMDDIYTIYAAVTVFEDGSGVPHAVGPANASADAKTYTIDHSKEVQMFQKVTVLPANVVYYEDDFDGISYDADKVSGSFITHTGSSDSWVQGVDQTIPYGQDPVYQDGGLETSGGSLTTYHINDEATFASFTFTGTGFEIVGRTNASDSGTMFVKVTDTAGAVVYHAPVITEFDNETNGERGGEAIYQVPVVRVDALALGTYHVEIAGGLEYDFDADKSLWTYNKGITQEQLADLLDNENDDYDGKVTGDGLKAWVEAGIITNEERNAICYDANGAAYPIDERTQNMLAFLGPLTPPAYAQEGQMKLYIDGVRVFQPLGENNANYRGGEDGASFTEIRELIMDGKAAFLHWQDPSSGAPLTLSSGKITLVEDRNGDYKGRQANTIEDYMMAGPNNEVYLRRTKNVYQVFALYVSEDPDAANKELQVGIRVMDSGVFDNGTVSAWTSMRFLYVQETEDGLKEVLLDEVDSGAEQYYTIDYTTCPYTTKEDGTKVYMVTLLARSSNKYEGTTKISASGMISLTGVKHNGLALESVLNDLDEGQYLTGSVWEFVNGVLQEKTTGQTLSCIHFDLGMLKSAATLEDTTDVEPAPEVEKAPVATPEVKPLAPVVEAPSKDSLPVYVWVIIGVAVAAVMCGAYLLTKKYMYRL